MKYRVVNMMTGEMWEGLAQNAKAAQSHIKINKGDTVITTWGKNYHRSAIKEF